MKVLLTLLTLVASLHAEPFHFNCIFDKVNQDLHGQSLRAKPDQGFKSNDHIRNLLSITRNQMRMTLDTSAFNTLNPGTNGTATTTQTNLNFILRTMLVAQNFYMKRLQVYPVTRIFAPITCVDFSTTANDQTNGISSSDLHVYVLYKTDSTLAYGATGKSCKYYGDLTTVLPDTTLQAGRPTMGRIIFNTYNLVDTQTILSNRLFQSITSTAIHETLHILGFDSTLYSYYLNPNTGNTYMTPLLTASPNINAQRPSTNLLTTPYVLAWAQTFFNCSTLTGMLLQNQDSAGTGAGSHWQRTTMYDELMTATSFGATKGMSALSFAILKDMGWYNVDDTFNQTTNYGYQKGCSFVLDACYAAVPQNYFCNVATQSSISTCQSDFFSKAVCSNVSTLMADGCGMYGPYFNCVDPASSNDGYQAYTLQVYGTSSFCVGGTLGSVPLPGTAQARCYPYVCSSTGITFTIGSNTITCLTTDAGTQKTLTSMTGYLTCPVYNDFCVYSRKTCTSWCSQNGYCMGGICNCYTGYYGIDCSQTICTTGTYYYSTNISCLSSCPSGYYQNKYSSTCLPCISPCQQCFGEPQICTGCLQTIANPKYFFNSTCYSSCPNNTYQSAFNCTLCSTVANCATCSISATNCTSCLGGNFLSQPGFGTCIPNCPISGTYVIPDVVNYICVSSCTNNLVLINNTCTMCAIGTYKDVNLSACVSNCQNKYYSDATLRLCATCDSSCLTCNGGYAQNCTACDGSTSLKYLLLQMCWSFCPKGFYANDTAGQCQICTVTLNCASCALTNNTILCTSCAYGYYFLTNACVLPATCPTNSYANSWNNSCNTCNTTCTTCIGPSSASCSSCTLPALFLANVTGGFCISTCPTIGYFQSGGNCLSCDSSCYTCSGISSSSCATCPSGYYLSSGYCLYVCPPASYPNSTQNKCLTCDGSCTYCFGPTINNCTVCINQMVLFNFTCTLTCPNGLTANQWNLSLITMIGLLAMAL